MQRLRVHKYANEQSADLAPAITHLASTPLLHPSRIAQCCKARERVEMAMHDANVCPVSETATRATE
jgi:hypothetical protein